MATTLPTPTDIADDYLVYLSSLQPDLNVDQEDSDWWIRSRVTGGVVAGVYADNYLISQDAFPQNARQDAIAQWLITLFGNDPVQGNFLPATISQGFASVTGNPGQVVSVSLQAIYGPNGNAYTVQAATTLDSIAGTGLVPFQSVGTGQNQNLNAGAIITFPSPPAGLNSTAVVASGGFSDATDQESLTAARARVLTRIRTPLGVGRVSDYIQYAEEADPSVTSASVSRYPFGLGTVGVYITSGTNNIDAAVDAGEPINVIPSQQLIDTVQAYLDINSPATDCVTVLAPSAVAIDVNVQVSLSQGTLDTILAGQSLSQRQLIQREVSRALYKTLVGGRILGASGYVLASDIEQSIDVTLSAEATETGTIPILLDRRVFPLTATGYNRTILPQEVPIPGTITVTVF